MKTLLAIWAWFNGKKTNIGAGSSVFTGTLVEFGTLNGLDHSHWWPFVIRNLIFFSALFSAGGLAHKFSKFKAAAQAEMAADAGSDPVHG